MEQFRHRHKAKRMIRLFYTLGILAPVNVNAKMFIQQLWKEGFNWPQIYAFSDAFEKAYGVIYIRFIYQQRIIRASLKQITLPRRELCPAKIATDSVVRVESDVDLKETASLFWTDSEIVLA